MPAKHKPVNFTKKSVERLPAAPPGKRTYYRDRDTRGLLLVVTDSVRKTWQWYRWTKGRPERVTLGTWPDLDVDKARGKAGGMNAQLADGKNPATEKRAARAEMTLGELWTLFLERHARPYLKPSTVTGYTWLWGKKLKPWAKRTLSSIRPGDVQRLHARSGASNGQYMANAVVRLIRLLYGKAAKWGYEGANPGATVTFFKERARERFLSGDELPRFFAALAEEPRDWQHFFALALLTGARRSNLQSMKWEALDLDGTSPTWRIAAAEAKGGQDMTLPLSPDVVAILKARRELVKHGPWVFPGDGKTGHVQEPKGAWARVCERGELGDLRIHDLRRSLGSWQAAGGASLLLIGRSLGHKSQTATAVYARLSLDPVRESVESAGRAMLIAGGLKPLAQVVQLKNATGEADGDAKAAAK